MGNIDLASAGLSHGVITRAQAIAAGLNAEQIDWRLESRQWIPLYRGVYLAGAHEGARTNIVAAIRAFNGVASHRSAAAIWGMDGFDDFAGVEITSKTKCHPPGIYVHRVEAMDRNWIRTREGILVTSPPRTLLDLGTRVHADHVEGALDHCLRKRWATWKELDALLSKAAKRGHLGARRLRQILALRADRRYLESILETRFLQLLRYAGLPRPVLQHVLGTDDGRRSRVDFVWPDARVIAETLGYEFHGLTREQFVNDARRSNQISRLKQFVTLRFVWADVHSQQEATCRIVAEALGLKWEPSAETRTALAEFAARIAPAAAAPEARASLSA